MVTAGVEALMVTRCSEYRTTGFRAGHRRGRRTDDPAGSARARRAQGGGETQDGLGGVAGANLT